MIFVASCLATKNYLWCASKCGLGIIIQYTLPICTYICDTYVCRYYCSSPPCSLCHCVSPLTLYTMYKGMYTTYWDYSLPFNQVELTTEVVVLW